MIDPRRDCAIYLEMAYRQGFRITPIFETHRNEDYVIGSRELAELTGAVIFHGAGLDFAYGKTVRETDWTRWIKEWLPKKEMLKPCKQFFSYPFTLGGFFVPVPVPLPVSATASVPGHGPCSFWG